MHECKPLCKGTKMIVLGAIVLGNYYLDLMDWWLLAGGLLVLKGLIVIAMKGKCGCCKEPCCREVEPCCQPTSEPSVAEQPKAEPKKKGRKKE